MAKPLVSVILPVYNPVESWLLESVESVASQTYSNTEIIIVDDFSDKKVENILPKKLREKVRLHRNQENKGFTKAMNTGLNLSNGHFISPIGQDDIWTEDKIEKQVRCAQEKNADLVFSLARTIDSKGDITGLAGIFPENNHFKNLLLNGCYPCFETALIHKDVFKQKLDDEYEIASDYELWLRVFRDSSIEYLDEPLAKKRIHDNNTSSRDVVKVLKEVKSIQKPYLEEESPNFRKKCFSNLYRHKGKQLINSDKKSARELFRKAISYRPTDPRNILLFFLSYYPELLPNAELLYKTLRQKFRK